MPGRLCLAAILAAIFLAPGCSSDEGIINLPPGTGDTVLVSFRDGMSPYPEYFGTRDAVLKDGPISVLRDGNFGHVDFDTLGSVFLAQSYYERRMILRFDLTPVIGCLSVLEAKVSVHVKSDCTDQIVVEAYEVILPPGYSESWPEGTGGIGGGISWLTIDGSAPWNHPGGDVTPILLDETTIQCDSVITLTLPNNLVFRWIESPQDNHGILIRTRNTAIESFRLLYLRESADAALRPMLWLKYLKRG
ncbi:MAG: hypothetical protein JSV33_09525 [bacterium]|nr:MAG: hypothetical protein JSV33_09525 [bacterium]